MFEHGVALDRHFETAAGIVWVTGRVEFVDRTLSISDLLVYPTTGSRLVVGASEMLAIARTLEREAIAQGFVGYALKAVRVFEDKPERIIDIYRRLR